MLKKSLALYFCLFVMTVCVPFSFSQELMTEDFIEGDSRFNTGVNLSVFIPGKSQFNTGLYIGANASYDIYRWLAIGIEGGWFQSNVKTGGVDLGNLHGAPLLGDLYIKFPFDMYDFILTPYGVAGAGVLFSDFDESGNVRDNGKIETNVPFLGKLGIGIDLTFDDTIVLYLEASYHYTKIDFDEKLTNQDFGLDKIDLNAGYLGGGVKYRF